MSVDTRAFGTVRATLVLPLEDERVDWTPSLAFPGVARGERLDG